MTFEIVVVSRQVNVGLASKPRHENLASHAAPYATSFFTDAATYSAF